MTMINEDSLASWARGCLIAIAFIGSACWCTIGRAQLMRGIPQQVLDPFQNPVDDEDEADDENAVPQNQFRMSPAQYDSFVYQQIGGSVDAFEQRVRRSIRIRIDQFDKICSFSDAQWEKLNAAIDIETESAQSKVVSMILQMRVAKQAKEQDELIRKAMELGQEFRSTSDAMSRKSALWFKVVNSILTDAQREKIARERTNESDRTRTAKLRRVVLQFQRKLGLKESQRVKLQAMLMDSDRSVPATFPEFWKRIASLPEHELATLFTPAQRESLQRQLMIPPLRTVDVIENEDPF